MILLGCKKNQKIHCIGDQELSDTTVQQLDNHILVKSLRDWNCITSKIIISK